MNPKEKEERYTERMLEISRQEIEEVRQLLRLERQHNMALQCLVVDKNLHIRNMKTWNHFLKCMIFAVSCLLILSLIK